MGQSAELQSEQHHTGRIGYGSQAVLNVGLNRSTIRPRCKGCHTPRCGIRPGSTGWWSVHKARSVPWN